MFQSKTFRSGRLEIKKTGVYNIKACQEIHFERGYIQTKTEGGKDNL